LTLAARREISQPRTMSLDVSVLLPGIAHGLAEVRRLRTDRLSRFDWALVPPTEP
jgi:hypothetical protein